MTLLMDRSCPHRRIRNDLYDIEIQKYIQIFKYFKSIKIKYWAPQMLKTSFIGRYLEKK